MDLFSLFSIIFVLFQHVGGSKKMPPNKGRFFKKIFGVNNPGYKNKCGINAGKK